MPRTVPVLLTVCLILSAAILAAVGPAAAAAPRQAVDPAVDVIAQLNAWRIENSLWPFKPNPTLMAAARAQAEYLLGLPELPEGGAMHIGANGEDPKARLRGEPFNWPVYGREDRVAVGENAYVGAKAEKAIVYWKSSEIHRTAALSPGYREVGAAALKHPFGYLFIVVFGARPNVLPALVDEPEGLLYLTTERYRWAPGGPWIQDVAQVRLLDADQEPLGDRRWMPWQSPLQVPPEIGDRFFVAYSDGKTQVVTEVNLTHDVAVLPGHTTLTFAAPTAVAAGPSLTPPPASALLATLPPPTATPTPTALGAQPGSAILVLIPTRTLVPPAPPEVRLVYTGRVLTIINLASGPRDFSGLMLVQGDQFKLLATAWQTEWLPFPLDAVPSRGCLQVWGWNETGTFTPPNECGPRTSAIYTAPDKRFWGQGRFEAQWRGQPLATCEVGPNICEFNLPQ